MTVSKRWVGLAILVASGAVATGCVGAPNPTGSPVPLVTSTAYVPQAMARSDGGPMLWPLNEEDGTGDPAEGTESLTRLAFLDANGRVVTKPVYRDFDICMSSDRPMRVVAVREGGIDVLSLDGTVTSTIATTAFNVPGGWADRLRCEDNKTVVAFVYHTDDSSVDLWVERRDTFDMVTGQRISSDRTLVRDECQPSAGLANNDFPEGYTQDMGGGWVESEDGTEALNLETEAVVQLADTEATFCSGAGGFLSCAGGVLPVVYDRNGALTPFASVDTPLMSAGCGDLAVPYLWATSASVQGYIDTLGTWVYQEPRYTYLSD